MISKTVRTIYSQVTLIPWSAMDTETEETPERGLHWGTRECDYIVSGKDLLGAEARDSTHSKPKEAK